MEDDRLGNKKLLVARSNDRCRKIYGWLWYMSENEKLNRGTSREVEIEWGIRKAINTYDGIFYHKINVSNWKRCNPSGLW